MQYQTPQFIEIEDKIFGPLTLRQFIYLAGAGGLSLAFFTLLPIWLAIICSLPIVIFALALAFYQINGRPFIEALEHAFKYQLGAKLYLWKQREAEASAPSTPTPKIPLTTAPKLSQSKLRDLSWSLNIKDRPSQNSQDSRMQFKI